MLMDFDAYWHRDNQAGGEKELYRLHIPEGVTAISSGMFRDCTVLWEMSFPKSLKYIGCAKGSGVLEGNTFTGCRLPDVVLPENLELFGCFAFGACRIRSLTIPGSLRESYFHIGVRQFKDCHIGEVRVPVEFRKALEDIWKDERAVSFSEMADSTLGRLCCVRALSGSLGWGDEISSLLGALF